MGENLYVYVFISATKTFKHGLTRNDLLCSTVSCVWSWYGDVRKWYKRFYFCWWDTGFFVTWKSQYFTDISVIIQKKCCWLAYNKVTPLPFQRSDIKANLTVSSTVLSVLHDNIVLSIHDPYYQFHLTFISSVVLTILNVLLDSWT